MTYVVERDVLDVLEDVAGNANVELRPGYSGRAMYGGTCVAIVADDVSGLARFLVGLVSAPNTLVDDLAERVSALVDEVESGGLRQDNMGLGYVFYWPRLVVEP